MDNKYYRVTCEGIGIYEYLKKYLWNNVANAAEVWDKFIKSSDTNWLNKPTIYDDKLKDYYSYFNFNGYKMFLERTLPLITNWIDRDRIKIKKVRINEKKIVYCDEYQVVIEINKLENQRNFVIK